MWDPVNRADTLPRKLNKQNTKSIMNLKLSGSKYLIVLEINVTSYNFIVGKPRILFSSAIPEDIKKIQFGFL